ncbi:hypothetical protein DPMN_035518 [Dreissena polymorpha]|uniref:Uncharacterized protein n=1 Tax=Dreissena polymorpha TaxID=45954 RepID=A0A9D4M8Y4_DREPO|nr:hypothetical protein DPMN_035518 [Dreissena polymorpha]
MSFNPSKCEVMHISKKRHPIKSEYLSWSEARTCKGRQIPWCDYLRELVLETTCSCSHPEGKQQSRLPEAQPVQLPTHCQRTYILHLSASNTGVRCYCMGCSHPNMY